MYFRKTRFPFVTVGALLVAPDGDVLLVQSKKWNNLYTTPGGKVEIGETREEALHREFWEETGLKLCNVRFAIAQECIHSHEFWKKTHLMMHDYIACLDPAFAKNQVVLNDEAYKYLWINPKEALNLPLQKETRNLIEWYLNDVSSKRNIGVVGFQKLQIQCKIGVYTEERLKDQIIFVDLKIKYNFERCIKTGNVQDSVDYVKLANHCRDLAVNNHYFLLEELASDILKGCFKKFDALWVWVRICKPSAVPQAEYAYIELEHEKMQRYDA